MPCGRTTFFGDKKYYFRFHKQKLLFHRASMQAYREYLVQKNIHVEYREYEETLHGTEIGKELLEQGYERLHFYDPCDWELQKRINALPEKQVRIHESPLFLHDKKYVANFFQGKSYHMTSYYIHERKSMGLLLTEEGKPFGGSWTYDQENRKKLPKEMHVPEEVTYENTYIKEARTYVEKNFPQSQGQMDHVLYPVTHEEAKEHLRYFLREKLVHFGPYEDALAPEHHTLFHSVLTPMLNTGLLTPAYVLETTLAYAREHPIPLASLEGFIRQIVGWREFMRGTYEERGVFLRTQNFFEHTSPIPKAFWEGKTGILPVDHVIQKVLKTGYAHHIERLMVLGNFMFLCEMHPTGVYTWFMEMFIDSCDWVMVPNVYGMSQFAAGPCMTTKPYFSGANYIQKMGPYPKGEWEEIWTALYWRFVAKHKDFLRKNARLFTMVSMWEKMPEEKKALLLGTAEEYLKKLFREDV